VPTATQIGAATRWARRCARLTLDISTSNTLTLVYCQTSLLHGTMLVLLNA